MVPLDRVFALFSGERIIFAALLVLLVALGFWAFLMMLINYFPEFFSSRSVTMPASKNAG